MRSRTKNYFNVTSSLMCISMIFGYVMCTVLDSCDKTRRVFTDSFGVITDGPLESNYTQDSHCEWLIKANGSNQFITLSFRTMGTECSYDYVFVYDGDSFRSPLLGSFSGKTAPQQVIATSGYMLILLYSDTNYVLNGFRAEFSVTDCPNNCSSHGECHNHQCFCENDWGGEDCSHRLCPEDCGRDKSHGYCEIGKCVCRAGYSGYACSLNNADPAGNKWHWLSRTGCGLIPRAAHTAVYLEEVDSLYVYGGYDLNRVLGTLEIYNFPNSTWTNPAGEILVDKTLQRTVDLASIAALLENVGPEGEEKWGLSKRNSFFRNLLYSYSNISNNTSRRIRFKRAVDEPAPRYGHAACSIPGGFLIFGGKLDNGSLSNELWSYDVFTRRWSLRAQSSTIVPPSLTRHSLTATGDMVYLFGGSTKDGEFSSKLFKIQLLLDGAEVWQYVQPRGGKELDVRVVAHSTVYHAPSNSLLVYGGVVAGVARFSKLSDRMFAFNLENKHWTELHYPREHLREKFVPRERAFHTANIIGNYLIVFGGYSHRHNKEEICYDNQMYLYHLGCHAWVNPDILGDSKESQYPKQQGVFAHAASVRNGNTLLLVGGYHGNVNGDLLAYTVPPMVAARKGDHYDPEAACNRHKKYLECSADPECGWCSADEQCYGRTVGANCTTNLQTTRCPGVCPALGDCHSCLIHGKPLVPYPTSTLLSAVHKLGLGECTWCVQNARCHHKDDNYGVCGLREDTPSQVPGWWGSKGTEVHRADQCREKDRRPGLTFLKYHHPVNWSQPDHVAIINATTVDFTPPAGSLRSKTSHPGEMVTRLLGFLRPPPQWQGKHEKLQVCVMHCNATLKLLDHKGDIQLSTSLPSTEKQQCDSQSWLVQQPSRILVDFEAHKTVNGIYSHAMQHSKMELQHYRERENAKVFTFEYLEPYANGSCSIYTNCLHCLTDSLCGWCELTSKCVSRDTNETESCTKNDDWRYLTLLPSACSNCSNYISCERCVDSSLCEWWIEDARCVRFGSGIGSPENIITAVTTLDKCPVPCFARNDCTSCLDVRGRCVWCEATQQCFSFSVYTSEYQFGLCREWLDQIHITSQEVSVVLARVDQCKSCQSHSNCSTCLSSLSCGWCYNALNPIEGKCVQGDFNRPQNSCDSVLSMNLTRWAYAQCPDVDECGLGLHDCHKEAICTNTDGSFSCKCRQGFAGDGKTYCNRTCDHPCVNGRCLGYPNYTCECNLGWTGENCSIDCGCNFHSNCTTEVGLCDGCQDWTTGEHCEKCLEGSFGNATSVQGCQQCDCNGHGNESVGICDMETGVCYCQDNTEGRKCERCKVNYYGSPLNGGQCYYQCEARGMLTDTIGQGISSRKSYISPWGGPPTRECLWIISPREKNAIIQLQVNASHLNVTCGENAVYVYDGMPELADTTQQSSLMAVFCREDAKQSMLIETRSGHLTVHYKQGIPGEGFNAVYTVLTCGNCKPPRFCKNEQCVCMERLVGPDCMDEVCPENCGEDMKRGVCDHNYGRCLCAQGWGGKNCRQKLNGSQIVFTELFNTQNLATHLEHLRKTLPRFGHSLVADHRRGLWMFGGYSLSHGPLNDIRLFDILNSTWMQVTVDSTPDAKMPHGRYYHATDIVHSRQAIYVYGGLTKHVRSQLNENILKDFWQFDLHNQRWNEIAPQMMQNWPPPLAGHTLTSYRNASYDSLIVVGGFSPLHGFLNVPWEYRLDKGVWTPLQTRGRGPLGLFGHSTVFHAPTNSLYIFGGYHYNFNNGTRLSNRLYALRYGSMVWVDLYALAEYTSPLLPRPEPRFLHSAVTTDNYMLVFGGRKATGNYSNSFFAYSYNCSQWINFLSEGIDRVGPIPTQTYAQSMTYENGSVYVVGGWGGESQCRVTRISVPEDLCQLWSMSKYKCLQCRGCAFCSAEQYSGVNLTHCYSNSKLTGDQCEASNGTLRTNNGQSCDGVTAQCSLLRDCTLCLQATECQWCPGCGGECVPVGQECYKEGGCTEELVGYNSSGQCPQAHCVASDCYQCEQMDGCVWTKIARDSDHSNKPYHYHCAKSTSLEPAPDASAVAAPLVSSLAHCSTPCVTYTECASCLDTAHCHWSTQLNECIALSHQPMYCLGGTCGLVLEPADKEYCPEPCEAYTQCSTCLRHAHCGWCALDDETGIGVCAEGSTEKPMGATCHALYNARNNLSHIIADYTQVNFTWNYVRCPPENECLNDHHTCNRDSEICEDLRDGFACKCGRGYHATDDGCMPVCSQGCVRGVCELPDMCRCDFGYVGANCSIECQCNGHSNCAGPDRLNECLQCHNDTMGSQCEKCKPLYVGNPKNRERCMPCLEYCNGHSHVCMDENSTEPEPYANMTLPELETYLKVGPVGKARCIRCANRTEGNKCEKCLNGYFRGSTILSFGCKPCNCHGHGDTCDAVTGDKCNCRNNTESNTTTCQAKNSNQDCSEVQCVKCRETYMGTPTDGHQCYKQMTVESKMCFDAKLIDECKMKPKPLVPGETVFFVVQPRFMNVDIRITIDVTQGSLNLFVSNRDDTFKVTPNVTSGVHDIDLDSRYLIIPPAEEDSAYEMGNTYSWMEHTARGLRTYVTIPRNTTLLAVKGLKDRLVITLPQDKHRLDNTKFYIVLQALPSTDPMPSTPSYGMVFFRQDQLHIDLFVFFSVFFSCFFLFLAACVVAWKAKQAADVRRARRRHVVEMLHMAQRPFASVTLYLGPSTPACSRRAKPRRVPPLADMRPVAVEPTDDGIAAVATVFVSLPGGHNTNVRLALASSLILLVRQYPSGGRAFLRRRSHHAVPQQPT